jgi:hypothetical protein
MIIKYNPLQPPAQRASGPEGAAVEYFKQVKGETHDERFR